MTKSWKIYDRLPERINRDADLLATDCDTGETQVLPVYLQKPKNKKYSESWLVLWQDDAEGTGVSILEQAADKRLNATDFRVRDYLLCKVGVLNYVHISQTEAAQYLGIAQPHISASIKKLIELGIVLEGPSKGRFKTYVMNPALVYKGKMHMGVEKRKESIKQTKVLRFPTAELEQGTLSTE